MEIIPNSHDEMHLKSANSLFFHWHKDIKKCGKGEWYAFHDTKNITYTDMYITFTTKWNEPKYFDLTEWHVEIYTDQLPQALNEVHSSDKSQISIFELLKES